MSSPDEFDAEDMSEIAQKEQAGVRSAAEELKGENRSPEQLIRECLGINSQASDVYKKKRANDRAYDNLVNRSLQNLYIAYATCSQNNELDDLVKFAGSSIQERIGKYKPRRNTHPLVTLCLAYSPCARDSDESDKAFRRRAMKEASNRAMALRTCFSDGIRPQTVADHLAKVSVDAIVRKRRSDMRKRKKELQNTRPEDSMSANSRQDLEEVSSIKTPKGIRITFNEKAFREIESLADYNIKRVSLRMIKQSNDYFTIVGAVPARPAISAVSAPASTKIHTRPDQAVSKPNKPNKPNKPPVPITLTSSETHQPTVRRRRKAPSTSKSLDDFEEIDLE